MKKQPVRLGALVRYRFGLLLVTLSTWILYSFYPLASGFLTSSVFNILTHHASLDLNLWELCLLLLATEVMGALLLIGWSFLHFSWENTIIDLIRRNFFQLILEKAEIYVANARPGEMINRFRDDTGVVATPLNEWYRLIGEALFALVALIIMARINFLITVAVIIPLAAIVILVHSLRARLANVHKKMRDATGQVSGFLGEIFDGVQAIQVNSVENNILYKYNDMNDERRKSVLRDVLFKNVLDSFSWNINNLSRGVIILLAAYSMSAGTFTIGDFALFSFYLDWILNVPRRVGRLQTSLKLAKVSGERLSSVVPTVAADRLVEPNPLYTREQLPEIPILSRSALPTNLGTVDVAHLTYHYPGSQRGIEDAHLHLKAGSFTVITGRIGSGKTTLLQTILGLLPGNRGEIYWNGERVDDPATFFVPPRCAYVPQVPRLFSETLKENILLGLPGEQVKLAEAVHLAVMEQDVASLDQGLETEIGVRGVKLSGGQVQRAAAARMFVRDTQLFIVDDLSSALDVETEQKLWERIFGLNDVTCLVVSHRRAALHRANHIIVLKDGRVEAEGTLEELLKTCKEMQQLWQNDIEEEHSNET